MIYLRLFFEFCKVGLFAVGGGLATIPFLADLGSRTGWFTSGQLADMIAVSESTPGPIAVNLATYIGYGQGGFWGSVLAVFGVTLPSFIIIILIAKVLKSFTSNKYVTAAMSGIRPVVAALIVWVGLSFLLSTVSDVSVQGADIKKIVIFLTVAIIYFISVFIFKRKLSSVFLIILSAFVGLGICMLFDTANI